MTQKLIIETERQLRDVYTADFSQSLLEQLAVNYMAQEQGIDLEAQGVRVQFETNVNPEARRGSKLHIKARIFVETPIDEEYEHGNAHSEGVNPSNANDSQLST